MKAMNNQLERLISLGYCLLPLTKGKKTPIIQQWTKNASNDPKVIEAWELQYPGCNWGLATGKRSGIIVIDIDPRHGGDIQWKRLTIGKKFKTTVCKTGGGGEHYYFRIPTGVTIGNSASVQQGIDIRGDGGQAVIPPSIHESGQEYTWAQAPWDTPPAIIPDWLLEIINKTNVDQSLGGPMVNGQRNNAIFHQALLLARQGSPMEFTVAAMKLWRDEADAQDISNDEVEKTVESAYKRGEQEKQARSAHGVEKTDSDNADRLVRLYNQKIRYASGLGWLIWNDKAWEPDEDDARIIVCATESMTMLRDEALEEAKIPEQFKTALSKAQWAMLSLNAGKLHSAVELASTRESIRVPIIQLDNESTHWMLNVKNGTVDLRTGTLLPHDSRRMITKMIDIDYDPAATCPFWEHTLELAFDNNQELITYMKRAIGYSITGSVDEQCLFICWGEHGNNGKSTILETIQHLLGPYAQMSDMKVITASDNDNRVASSLAKLPGVRLVSMNEAEENQRLSEALIKQLTGGDTIQACKKFKAPFEFNPLFKLWIRTNEKPIIRGMSNAIWRRIKLIPFEKPIPAEFRRRRSEVDEMLKLELKGILAWCIEGALEWSNHGLPESEIVTAATAGYRSEMDIIESFFDDCVITNSTGFIPRSDLYQTFSRWAKENGIRFVMTSDAFGKRVGKKLGAVERTKHRGQYIWQGISLTEFAKTAFIM